MAYWDFLIFLSSPVSEKYSLERVEFSVDSRPTRQRVPNLLGKHVTKKRPRLSSQSLRFRKKSTVNKTTHLPSGNPVQTIIFPSTNQLNYAQFNNFQLIDMLKDVRLDTNRSSKIELLKNCNSYHELSKYHLDTI